jgi:CubicO group peptidase (beta-lactamase class C family)
MLLRVLLLAGAFVPAADDVWPGERWETAEPATMGLDAAKLAAARDYALTADGAGHVIYKGKLVMSWGDPAQLFDLKSTSKSIGVTLLGVALKDGKVALDDPARKHHPDFGVPPEANAQTGWLDRITLRMLADQTAGFDKPGGYQPLLFQPGTKWHYSDGGPNWLAECLTRACGRDLDEVIFERVFTSLGIRRADVRWRKHAYRPDLLGGVKRREFGSGFSANVNAMARLGYLYLRGGRWKGEEILPPSFVRAVRQPDPALAKLPVHDPTNHGGASSHYSLLWWNNLDGALAGVPRDAFWSWGLHDSLIVVIPSLDLVVARAGPGKSWSRKPGARQYDVLRPFLEPIAAAVPALWPSPVIQEVRWAPVESIVRKAKGSDNWPLTWAKDGHLYTAFGDGRGFEPFLPAKLSLGLARIEGGPGDFRGINLRSPTAEAVGDGARGRKASGLLCVDGVLYLWVRNVANAQLGWSEDQGATWTWADWRISRGFGAPAFLNHRREYGDARDGFVYVYSHDSDSAYERADRYVMARVPKERLRDRAAYEFFVERDGAGGTLWSPEIDRRGAVVSIPGGCYRSSVSYNFVLMRYLWCQTGAGKDTRFAGGFRILDAPEPWGPWTVAFSADPWDVGPGESMHFPTKWMSDDGLEAWLVFSGDDCFSVRRATFVLRP